MDSDVNAKQELIDSINLAALQRCESLSSRIKAIERDAFKALMASDPSSGDDTNRKDQLNKKILLDSELFRVNELLADRQEKLAEALKAKSEYIVQLNGLETQLKTLNNQLAVCNNELSEARDEHAKLRALVHQAKRDTTELNDQLVEAHKQLLDQGSMLQVHDDEAKHFRSQLQDAEVRNQDACVAIENLHRELRESRSQVSQLREALQPQKRWKLWLEQEQQRLNLNRAQLKSRIEQHSAELRELSALRIECARRYTLIRSSEQLQVEQANKIINQQKEIANLSKQLEQVRLSDESARLRLHCSELESKQLKDKLIAQQGEMDEARQANLGLGSQLKSTQVELAELRIQFTAQTAQAEFSVPAVEKQVLQRQLSEALDEIELLRFQLHTAQKELERYHPLSLDEQTSAVGLSQQHQWPQSDPQGDTEVINAFRQRLLASP